jgi:ribosomal protein S27AE
MRLVSCPRCGEDEDLTGTPHDETILLTCGACGASWDRDTRLVCGVCGSTDVEGIPTSTLEEAGRGDQRTPSGIRLVHYCWECRGNDVTSANPQPGPHPPPGRSRDVRALRRTFR